MSLNVFTFVVARLFVRIFQDAHTFLLTLSFTHESHPARIIEQHLSKQVVRKSNVPGIVTWLRDTTLLGQLTKGRQF